MTSPVRLFLLGSGLTALACLCVAAPAAASSSVPSTVASVYQTVLPGSALAISSASSGAGEQLTVTLPASDASAPPQTTLNQKGLGNLVPAGAPTQSGTGPSGNSGTVSTAEQNFANSFPVAGTGWLGELAAGEAGILDPSLLSYAMESGVTQTNTNGPSIPAGNYYQGYLRDSEDSALAGQPASSSQLVSIASAEAQMKASLATLQGVFPAGDLTTAVTVVPVGPSSQNFGLDVQLTVSNEQDLSGHLGDIFDGLDSGLISGSQSTIAGLAITVSVGGTPVAGQWQAPVAGQAANLYAPSVTVPSGGLSMTTSFPDLTGGPAATNSAFGAPGKVASGSVLSGRSNAGSGSVIVAIAATVGGLVIVLGLVLVLIRRRYELTARPRR